MAEAVFMPKQGQSVESCVITQWYKKKGEEISEGDILFSYETDKAAFDEEAKISGILLETFYDEGDEVPVLNNVAVIGKKGENISEFSPDKAANELETNIQDSSDIKPSVTSEASTESTPSEKIRISPRARLMAEDKEVDISTIKGSGPNGRIIARDIEAIGEKAPASELKQVSRKTDYSAFEGDFPGATEKPVTNIRKIIAENMQASLQNSAQLTHHLCADARKILKLRKEIKSRIDSENLENITLNDMVCYSVIQTLRKHPDINAHFLGDKIREFNKVHLGIAVDTDRGLMVPVLKNADEYNLSGLASKLKKLAHDCRKGKADPELLQSLQGSFTVSNLGAYGIEMFTPVLNIPQVGILGVNTIKYEPRDISGTIGFIPVIGLSLSYDHRAVDGAPASAFLKALSDYIGQFPVEIS